MNFTDYEESKVREVFAGLIIIMDRRLADAKHDTDQISKRIAEAPILAAHRELGRLSRAASEIYVYEPLVKACQQIISGGENPSRHFEGMIDDVNFNVCCGARHIEYDASADPYRNLFEREQLKVWAEIEGDDSVCADRAQEALMTTDVKTQVLHYLMGRQVGRQAGLVVGDTLSGIANILQLKKAAVSKALTALRRAGKVRYSDGWELNL